MNKYKKALLFILGFLFIPETLSLLAAYILGLYDEYLLMGYFALVYLLIYFTFPLLYRKDVPKRFPNRYTLFAVLYLIFFLFGLILALYITD